MVELALAFTDKDGSYAEHAAVVLTSVFRNTSSQVNVHILHDESLTRENMLRIKQLATHYNHTVKFYSIFLAHDLAEVVGGAQSVNTWTWGSMYRLLLPSLLDVSKVIYLDCDVLVNLDIQELWNIDLNGYYLAAARDKGAVGLTDILSPLGLNPDTYFNSGVIIFELNNIRQNSEWYMKMQDFLRQYPSTTLPDQDVLNHLYGDNYLQLGEEFNAFSTSNTDLDFNHKIVHFAGETKWWDPVSPGFALYQEYLNLTPWRLPGSHFSPAGPIVPEHGTELDERSFTFRLDHGEPSMREESIHAGNQPPVQPVHSMKKARMKRSKRLKKLKKLTKLKLSKRPVKRTGFARRIHRVTPMQRKSRLKRKRRVLSSYPGKVMHSRTSRRVVVRRQKKVTRTA